MTRAARAAAACAVTLLAMASLAGAYNDDPDADQVFPSWMTVVSATPMPQFNAASVFYEVYATGVHRAEAHFRNVSDATIHLSFWAPGFQNPGDNARLSLRPYFVTKAELKVPLVLCHGRPGLSAAQFRVFDVVSGDADAGRAAPELGAIADSERPSDDWMPVVALRDPSVMHRACLMARVARVGGATVVAFRNPSARDLHFQFQVPALGQGPHDAARVHVVAGGEATATVRTVEGTKPAPLLRVFVSDVRAGEDTGRLLAEDRSADAGWFPLVTADHSAPLPHDKLLATIVPSESGARVRFRSRMRTEVRLRFVIGGYQSAGHDNGVVTLAPGGESEVDVALDTAADARLPVARLVVTDVAHQDDL